MSFDYLLSEFMKEPTQEERENFKKVGRRSLDSYVRTFEEKGGLGKGEIKFFGQDVDGFTREELLALVGWLSEELSRAQERNTRCSRGVLGL